MTPLERHNASTVASSRPFFVDRRPDCRARPVARSRRRSAECDQETRSADSVRITLRGSGHRIERLEVNIIGPPSVEEELVFPISLEQLAQLAGAHSGGVRIAAFDMPMQSKIIETASLAYRTAVCSPTLATAANTE
jgi:hypothetical protein